MSNPTWLWLTNANSSPVIGKPLVTGRPGAFYLRENVSGFNNKKDSNNVSSASLDHQILPPIRTKA